MQIISEITPYTFFRNSSPNSTCMTSANISYFKDEIIPPKFVIVNDTSFQKVKYRVWR